MSQRAGNDHHQKLEAMLAGELLAHTDRVSVGDELAIAPSEDFWASLEVFVSRVLGDRYREWKGESIDGWFASVATKTGSRRARFAGTCILISDQSVTPFLLELSASHERDSIDFFEVSIGEAGGGRLGISGPMCTTSKAGKILETLASRLGRVEWVYTASRPVA